VQREDARSRMLRTIVTLRRVTRCEADWRETERRVAATAVHVQCRKAVFSCLASCEEGVSGNLTATVGWSSKVALPVLSVCLYLKCTNTEYSVQRSRHR